MKSRGFTLIELLVVIAIIGLLASIILASLSSARQKGVNGKIQADVHQWHLALEIYYAKHGYYPLPSVGTSGYVCLGNYNGNGCWSSGTPTLEDAQLDAALSETIPSLPQGQSVLSSNGNTYTGYIYHCQAPLNSNGQCVNYIIRWAQNGANLPCTNEQGTFLQNIGKNVSECTLTVSS